MCDTFVALPGHTDSGNLILGKNSDREPNEAQAIERVPAQSHKAQWLQCTYIRIPQVKETYEVILSRPFHMWGAEMGANEHGLVIGNEAVFTKIRFRRRNDGLTGMDMLRLALERTKSAEAALECITSLLEQYGQDACGGYRDQRFFYHNSFIIADKASAWILETAGRQWAAKQVAGFASISNGLTIEEDYHLLSKEAIDFARKKGWSKKGQAFNFRKAFSDWFYTYMGSCRLRQEATFRGGTAGGRFSVQQAMELLATHNLPEEEFQPGRCTTASLCMHATGPANPSQTTGSMVAEIRTNGPSTLCLTGTASPCLSVYKPYFFGGGTLMGAEWKIPGPLPDESLWWQAEGVFRKIARNYQARKPLKNAARRELQRALLAKEKHLLREGADIRKLDVLSEESLQAHGALLTSWDSEMKKSMGPTIKWNPLFYYFRRRIDRAVGVADE